MFKTILKAMVSAVVVASAAAHAAPVVFDRGLPTTNLNDAAGASRSNVAWGFGASTPAYYSGDNFTLGAGNWNINTVRVWAVIGPTSSTSSTLIADRYSSISLYGGSGTTLTNLMSGTTTGNTTDNPNITINKVQYSGANLEFDSLINSNGDGWDKSSDINVQIEASAVPEPASIALFGLALAGMACTRRKRGVKR